MKKRILILAAWELLACALYFFENNTGTRIVLLASLLLPLHPLLRTRLLGQDPERSPVRAAPRTVPKERRLPGEELCDVRPYQPGDPVNRIHWKLSARRDELLLRVPALSDLSGETACSASRDVPPKAKEPFRLLQALGGIGLGLSLALLAAVPAARRGLLLLMNRLFDASEAVNAYAYARFSVTADASPAWAIALLLAAGLSLLVLVLFSRSRLPALIAMTSCVLFQIYFGLALPAWLQGLLFLLFLLRMMKPPRRRPEILSVLSGVALLFLTVLLIWPGVDASTEAASEAVRDRLSTLVQSVTGSARELPSGESETRHVHPLSQIQGDQEAPADRMFQLVTVEEEQISMPHWVDVLRILLLLLLMVAAVVLPFLPLALLNRKRRKALEARRLFLSDDVSEAICAIFQHVIAWLDAMGCGTGNLPYAQWRPDFAPAYGRRFARCEQLFEEALYSTHPMREEQRQQVLELLEETEAFLKRKADWRQRLRLRYREFLWI